MTSGVGAGVRGTALAVLGALLTTTGHVAGGGALPDLALLVVLLPLLCAVTVALADRAAGVAGVVGTLAAGQLALHHLLALLHPVHTAAAGPVVDGTAMLALHAAATLATALAVRHADAATGAVRAALRRVLPRRPLPRVADRPLPAAVPAAPAVGRRLAGALAAAHVRRGPPGGVPMPAPHPDSGETSCPDTPGARCAPPRSPCSAASRC